MDVCWLAHVCAHRHFEEGHKQAICFNAPSALFGGRGNRRCRGNPNAPDVEPAPVLVPCPCLVTPVEAEAEGEAQYRGCGGRGEDQLSRNQSPQGPPAAEAEPEGETQHRESGRCREQGRAALQDVAFGWRPEQGVNRILVIFSHGVTKARGAFVDNERPSSRQPAPWTAFSQIVPKAHVSCECLSSAQRQRHSEWLGEKLRLVEAGSTLAHNDTDQINISDPSAKHCFTNSCMLAFCVHKRSPTTTMNSRSAYQMEKATRSPVPDIRWKHSSTGAPRRGSVRAMIKFFEKHGGRKREASLTSADAVTNKMLEGQPTPSSCRSSDPIPAHGTMEISLTSQSKVCGGTFLQGRNPRGPAQSTTPKEQVNSSGNMQILIQPLSGKTRY